MTCYDNSIHLHLVTYKFILSGGFTVCPDLVVVTVVLHWFALALGSGMGTGGSGFMLSNLCYTGISTCLFQLWQGQRVFVINGSFEGHMSTLLRLMTLPVCNWTSCLIISFYHNALLPTFWLPICNMDQYIRTFIDFLVLSNTALIIVELI